MYFVMFSNCIIVNGATRSTINDLQKNKIYFIPNELACFIIDNKYQPDRNTINKSIFISWFEMLISEELGFYTKNPEFYPQIDMKWDSPEIINNSIIEMDDISEDILFNSIMKLNKARCKFIEFRYYKESNIELLFNVLNVLKEGYLRGIILYIPYSTNNFILQINKLLYSTGLIREIIIHSCEIDLDHIIKDKRISFTSQIINSNSHCGEISSNYFSINLNSFSESKNFNNCLNKKITINSDGQVKNCPSMIKTFGNIIDIDIIDVTKNLDFNKYWNITKDEIEICKDCEFRFVCTDCRAYTQDPENQYSKPLKCGYNPYTNEWVEWSTNPLKQKAIEYYEMQELVKND